MEILGSSNFNSSLIKDENRYALQVTDTTKPLNTNALNQNFQKNQTG
jgi:hypothetical protein